MSAAVIRFPPRSAHRVWLLRDTNGAWLVLARDHGWLHGSYLSALTDARWLARNLGLSICFKEQAYT
jgi:hypothetical protein